MDLDTADSGLRHQQILDEVLDLEPGQRRRRLAAAVTAGDLAIDEADEAVRIARRLEAVRDMTIPAWPAAIAIVPDRVAIPVARGPAASARPRARHGRRSARPAPLPPVRV